MDGAPKLALVLKAWLPFALAIATLCNSRLAAGNNHYGGRKLNDEIPGVVGIVRQWPTLKISNCGIHQSYDPLGIRIQTSIIDDARESALVLKAWLVSVLVIAFLGSAKQDAGNNEHTGRKLVADEHPGFISIDCGSTENYRDDGTGIFYESDSGFIDTGTNQQISSDFVFDDPDFYAPQIRTLRSFPDGKRNCYTLKPTQGKNSNYLIRAIFSYGNYDNKNQPPVFNVHVGVNYWDTVEFSSASWVYYPEIIHTPSSDTISVCLINTGSGVPIISSLELRPVDKPIYPFEYQEALDNTWRNDLGNSSDEFL
ncbi:putative lrr receptor-like serine/threonine-protein kinase, partial [Fagus crenata]